MTIVRAVKRREREMAAYRALVEGDRLAEAQPADAEAVVVRMARIRHGQGAPRQQTRPVLRFQPKLRAGDS